MASERRTITFQALLNTGSAYLNAKRHRPGKLVFREGEGIAGIESHSFRARQLEATLVSKVLWPYRSPYPAGESVVEALRVLFTLAPNNDFDVTKTHGRGKNTGITYTTLTPQLETRRKEEIKPPSLP